MTCLVLFQAASEPSVPLHMNERMQIRRCRRGMICVAQSLGGEHLSDLSAGDKAGLPALAQAPDSELGVAPETTA